MSDDWQVGDLALCVRDGPDTRAGVIYTVEIIGTCPAGVGLRFFEMRRFYTYPWKWSIARRFRKIRPHTPDADDRETIALLKGKPVREREGA